jgi:ATP adenylyltransferase
VGSEGALGHLFAPWRFEYVSSSQAVEGCIFCAAARGSAQTLTLASGELAFALLNRYPYTSGHAMVAPVAHVSDLLALDEATLSEMMALAKRVVRALELTYHPNGFNLGFNLGEAAGAGIADHLHMHVVPRWRGDTSFMTVSSGVRVIPEGLDQTWQKVRAALEAVRD